MPSNFYTQSDLNPVIIDDGGGDPYSSVVLGSVIYVNGLYYAYYGRFLSDEDDRLIHMATSTDGENFTKYAGNPVVSTIALYPKVVYHDGYWWMYCTGIDGPNTSLLKSPDGYNFSLIGTVLIKGDEGDWDYGYAYPGTVIYREDLAEFWLYYKGASTTEETPIPFKVGLATSTDGVNFTKHSSSPLLEADQTWEGDVVYDFTVFKYGAKWHSYYRGNYGNDSQIGYAYSEDGITWTKSPLNPIVSPSNIPNTWDYHYLPFCSFVFTENDPTQPGLLYLGGVGLGSLPGSNGNEIGLYIQDNVGVFGVVDADLEASKDTFVHKGYPTSNYGASSDLRIIDSTSDTNRLLLEFNTTPYSGRSIVTAYLYLYYYNWVNSSPVGKVVNIYKLTRTDWVELEATWDIYKTGDNWSLAGGDFVTSSPSGAQFTIPASYGWIRIDISGIVQDALDNAANTELMIQFANEGGSDSYTYFYSRSAADNNPKLQLVFGNNQCSINKLNKVNFSSMTSVNKINLSNVNKINGILVN